MLRHVSNALGLLCGMALLSSCAATFLVDTWRNPAAPGGKLHKLLIVQMVKGGSDRRVYVYEQIIANELQQRGVQSVPSYAVLPENQKRDRRTLEGAARQAGADAILIMQTIKVERQTSVDPGYVSTYPDYPYGYPGYYRYSYPSSWDLYGYGSSTYYEPPYVYTYQVATIQVNLFDLRGTLLWAATVQTSEPGNLVPVGKSLAKIILKSLSKEGLI